MSTETINQPFNQICVVGLGYIGLPTAAVLASRKMNVLGFDINPIAVETINRGEIHIVEPELDILVHAVVTEKRLRARLSPEPADAFLIAVPTPCLADHKPDLQYVEAACRAIAPMLRQNNLVIVESTSPVGTTERMSAYLAALRSDLTFPQPGDHATAMQSADIYVAYCPERVMPGQILHEIIKNDRIIGGITPRCAQRACELYQIFVEGQCLLTTARTAEMCKLTENSYRDVNIAFANELSIICDKENIDVWELIRLANHHPRVNILQPGPGVGGHCIAVDPWFIVSKNPEEARLIHTARLVNDDKPTWVVDKVNATMSEWLKQHPNKRPCDISLVCFGLTFKPNVDDLRESPALSITEHLANSHSGPLWVVDPYVQDLPTSLQQKATLTTAEEALKEADIVLILVNHRDFSSCFEKIPASCKLIDTRGVNQNVGGRHA